MKKEDSVEQPCFNIIEKRCINIGGKMFSHINIQISTYIKTFPNKNEFQIPKQNECNILVYIRENSFVWQITYRRNDYTPENRASQKHLSMTKLRV